LGAVCRSRLAVEFRRRSASHAVRQPKLTTPAFCARRAPRSPSPRFELARRPTSVLRDVSSKVSGVGEVRVR
jgi:hypothetical protein